MALQFNPNENREAIDKSTGGSFEPLVEGDYIARINDITTQNSKTVGCPQWKVVWSVYSDAKQSFVNVWQWVNIRKNDKGEWPKNFLSLVSLGKFVDEFGFYDADVINQHLQGQISKVHVVISKPYMKDGKEYKNNNVAWLVKTTSKEKELLRQEWFAFNSGQSKQPSPADSFNPSQTPVVNPDVQQPDDDDVPF